MPPASTEHLALLYRLSQTFNSSLDLEQVLDNVIDEVIAATRAERGFLMLRDAAGRLTFSVARGMDHRTIDSPQFQISRSVVDRVASEGVPQLTSDAQADSWLGGRRSVVGLGLRSILCVPLQVKGVTLGVIYVDNRLQAGIFNRDDLELLTAIGATAAIAIENARLYQVAVEKGRMERELQVALEVQASLIPREMPRLDNWELATYWQPARIVGGDLIDIMPGPQDSCRIAIGDVSDKGMAAALFMAMTRTILRASSVTSENLAECLEKANRLIAADSTRGMFVTLFCAELQPGRGAFTYVNAGHNPPLFFCCTDGHLEELPRTGMALGIDGEARYAQGTIEFRPGDYALLYTDGVTEASDAAGRAWGLENLQALACRNSQQGAAGLIAALRGALEQFAGTTPQYDDLAVLAARYG
ncbi:MAG: PP2C family protein-serine/threonine phosphatase [Rudaea sp.]